MKPVYSRLRILGFSNAGYIDDSLICADTQKVCKDNVSETISLTGFCDSVLNISI